MVVKYEQSGIPPLQTGRDTRTLNTHIFPKNVLKKFTHPMTTHKLSVHVVLKIENGRLNYFTGNCQLTG